MENAHVLPSPKPGTLRLSKSTLLHLRVPFSFFLLPVYLFALSNVQSPDITGAILSFVILHLLVFPSSNGYNSYNDRDTSSIGLLKQPPAVTYDLFIVTLVMDIVAVVAGLFVSVGFAVLAAVFILMSRAYSFRKIRLKKNPLVSFLVVTVFQGGFIYLMTLMAASGRGITEILNTEGTIRAMFISSLFIGSIYPLTQIYQHRSDRMDGVISLSYLLGYTGSFIFSMALFGTAILLMYFHFQYKGQLSSFLLFSLVMIPVLTFFLQWLYKVRRDTRQASYSNSMLMNFITSLCMNTFFMIMILQ